ncbi:hypothetical protein KSS87_019343, partial [Heliosperma pusillum]
KFMRGKVSIVVAVASDGRELSSNFSRDVPSTDNPANDISRQPMGDMMFQALARDRLERLNASPSATPWTYFRVYSALLFVLTVDFLWVWFCAAVSGPLVSSTYWLLFFEPLSIAFETLQAMVVHGFQLMDIWLHHSAAETSDSQRSKLLDSTAVYICNIGESLRPSLDWRIWSEDEGRDTKSLVWFTMGMEKQYCSKCGLPPRYDDAFNGTRPLRAYMALLSALLKRVKGFIKLKIALGALHEALPDASSEEIRAYDDECAICREPMAKAKRLPCKHLFHLACLRSWLDQGLNEVYSCPTCRKPLFAGQSESEASSNTTNVSSDEQLARQLSAGLDLPNVRGLGGVFPNQNPNSIEPGPWRETGADPHWLQPWQSQGLDRAGPSTAIRSVGLGRVQMMMRHLASVGETYAQTALEDTSWNLWPGSTSQGSTSGTAFPPAAQRYPAPTTVHRRVTSNPANDSIANLLAMAETVREVLPHVPDEIIFQDLQQTNSVAVTVNNLLQM